ncbi:hypothetical protein ACFO5X_10785 [Seohaeicola nanhaiensis]|uniref:Uncharacterized protein n=1 Tax=Seohaeicola nanhaiensis TaxID=1387282 RepID=A0ABV9KGJ4_9RHOB
MRLLPLGQDAPDGEAGQDGGFCGGFPGIAVKRATLVVGAYVNLNASVGTVPVSASLLLPVAGVGAMAQAGLRPSSGL